MSPHSPPKKSHPHLLLDLSPDPRAEKPSEPSTADTPAQSAAVVPDDGAPAGTSDAEGEAEAEASSRACPTHPPPGEFLSAGIGEGAARPFFLRLFSALFSSEPGAAPLPPVDLRARAPRPAAVRLRRTLAVGTVLGASLIVAGSLTWAFVVRPEIRAGTMARTAPQDSDERLARPPRSLSERPGRYDQLPAPRNWPVGLQEGGSSAGSGAGQDTAPISSPPPTSTPAPYRGSQYAPLRPSSEGAPSYPRSTDHSLAGRQTEPPLEVRAHGSQLFFTGSDGGAQAGRRAGAAGASDQSPNAMPGEAAGRDIYNPARLTRPLSPYEIKAGSVIPASLLTAVDTSHRGPAAAVVTRNIYDTVTGRHLLAPQGSRLIGRYDGDSAYGDRKAFIVWERLLLPDGRSLSLDDEPGVDAAGALGSQGRVDRRLLPLALAVMAGGAVTAIGQAARDSDGGGGLIGDAGDAASLEAARTGASLIDRELQVRPVIKLAPGSSVGVLITRDLVLEPWRQ
jgi:type IV secretory pathway VirB10-like protein